MLEAETRLPLIDGYALCERLRTDVLNRKSTSATRHVFERLVTAAYAADNQVADAGRRMASPVASHHPAIMSS